MCFVTYDSGGLQSVSRMKTLSKKTSMTLTAHGLQSLNFCYNFLHFLSIFFSKQKLLHVLLLLLSWPDWNDSYKGNMFCSVPLYIFWQENNQMNQVCKWKYINGGTTRGCQNHKVFAHRQLQRQCRRLRDHNTWSFFFENHMNFTKNQS